MKTSTSPCVSSMTGKPLSAHFSESFALADAVRIKLKYGNDLIPYHCSRCQQWHLGKGREKWPECSYCRGRGGDYKISYPTERDAVEQAARLERGSYVRLRVYECRHEHAWHLTST